MCKNYNNYDWFYSGLKVSKGSISCNASPIYSFSCLSPSALKVASTNDVFEVGTLEKFKDTNKFSSTYKFTLLNSISMARVIDKELFFFTLFLKALLLATNSLVDLFFLRT